MKINDLIHLQELEQTEEIEGARGSNIPFVMSPFVLRSGTDLFSASHVGGDVSAVANPHLNKYTAIRFESYTDENNAFASASVSSGIGARLWNHRT